MPKDHRSPSTIITICGILATGIGFVALLGWLAGLPILSSLGPGRIPMAPSTALLFMLYGLGVILLTRSSPARMSFRVGMVIGAAGAMFSLLLFILSSIGIHLEAEHLGLRIVETFNGAPIGHMSPVTAFCFMLVGLSFLLSLSSSTVWTKLAFVAFWSSVLVLLFSLVLLLAYILGSPLLYGSSVIPPSLPTSLAFLLLGTALLVYSGQRVWPHSSLSDMANTRSTYVLVTIFILLFFGIITAGYLYLRNYEKEYRIGVEQQLSSVAKLKVSNLEQYRRERLGDAFLIFKNDQFLDLVRHFFTNPEDASRRIQIHSWLKKLQEYYQYDQVQLLDAHGVTRLSAPAGLPPVSAVIEQRASEVLRTREVAFQDFYLDEYDHRPYLSLIVPILDTNGDKRSIGAVTLRIDPETYLYPFISLWPSPSRTAETLIIRREGNDVLFLNELRFRKNTALTLRIPLERKEVVSVQAALGRSGIVEGFDYAGVSVVADVRAVPDSPWVLIARMNVDEIYAPLRQQLWTVIALIGALLIGAGSGVALLWRQQHVRFYQERYEAGEELRKSEERYHALVSNVHEVVYAMGVSNDSSTLEVQYVNDYVATMLGYQPADFVNDSGFLLTVVHPDDVARLMESNQRIFSTKETAVREYRMKRKEKNDYIWIEDHAVLRLDKQGKIIGVFGVARDITERKSAEESLKKYSADLENKVKERTSELEKANAELRKLFNAIEQSAESIVITDVNGAIEYVNPAFTKKTGYSKEEAIRKNPRILQSGLTSIALYNELWKTILSGNPWRGILINKKKSGEIYYEDATIAPVFDEHSKITHFVAAKTDVTDRIMAEEELKRKNTELELAKVIAEAATRAKSDFLASMSHELRTPLNSIIGFSEILKDGMAGPIADNQKELLNDISTSGKQLLSLINDILDLSKVETGQMELELSEFNIEELIDGSLVMFREKAMKHNIKIAADVDAGIGNIIADERKIKQVLFNLLSNAFKFTPDGGSVRVTALKVAGDRGPGTGKQPTSDLRPSTPDKDFIEISVTDTGIGISPEDQKKLFQPFQQIDSALSRKYAGTGLGLNLCKQFVELHGGRIWMESLEGKGSRFVFVIPVKKEE